MGFFFYLFRYVVYGVVGFSLYGIACAIISTIKDIRMAEHITVSVIFKTFFSTIYDEATDIMKNKIVILFVTLLTATFAIIISPTIHDLIGRVIGRV